MESTSSACSADAGTTLADPEIAHLASLIPVVDLRCNPPAQLSACRTQEEAVHEIGRVLFRSQQRHALVCGPQGIGKTSTLLKFAREVGADRYPFLSKHALLYVDAVNVGPEDSRACLETMFAALTSSGRTVVLADGIASLFSASHGRNNRPLLRAMLSRPGVSVIGTLSHWDYAELVGNDALMLRAFCRVDLDEPDDVALEHIISRHLEKCSHENNIALEPQLARRVISLTSTFLLSESQPAKSVNVVTRACEDLKFDRLHADSTRTRIGRDDLVRVIADRTGIPFETVAGQTRRFDFYGALTDAIVGQDDAVRQVATELELIAAGLSEPDKPASVMMFAGTTGVGKTELAKRIAELYSSSGRLRVYPMGNFTEAHSVSGLIGVPPGYVGHEEGGQLINDLLADPYTVFLLDEAEKCHPNIWKPFLNLFDEGWIIDKRGRKAHADRAIFILTTNAGDRNISQLKKSGKSAEEISEQVRKSLSRVRQERSSQPVFPPQFLSRMKRIIVFNPLTADALISIANKVVSRACARWKQVREKELLVSAELVRQIGICGHATNELLNGEEGGRIIQKLVREAIEHSILVKANAEPDRYAASRSIRVLLAEVSSDRLRSEVVFE